MSRLVRVLCTVYGWLVRLYPPDFRAAFGDEMCGVFAEVAADAASRGLTPLMGVWLRELWTYPGVLGLAYQRWVSRIGSTSRTGGWKTMETNAHTGEVRAWEIRDRGRARVAASPPLIFGIGIALSALAMLPAGRSWFDLASWQQVLGIALMLLSPVAIGVGALVAAVRRVPDWGYTWIGSALMAAAIAIKTLAEERADVGGYIVSPVVDAGIALAIVFAGGVFLLIAAWRGWAQAGLTGSGYAAIFGLSLFSLVRAAPFNRSDLALLAAPLGLLQAGLLFLYVWLRGDRLGRWGCLLGIWFLNALPILMAHRVWQSWLSSRGGASPVGALLVIVTLLAWAGPLAGLLGRPIRRALS